VKAQDFDHAYAEQLGLVLAEDPQQWQRGCMFLRIAGKGQPVRAPNLFITIGKAYQKFGDTAGQWQNYMSAIRSAKTVGLDNVSAEDKVSLFAVAKLTGDHASQGGDVDTALECYKFYSQYEKSGVETWRTLAGLFERKGDAWMALHCTEHALSYPGAGSDQDLQERKDRIMYTITPEEVKERWENVGKWFDVEYCLTKTKWLLERYQGDQDLLDWASHLTAVARAAWPGSIQVRLLQARIHRLRGETAEAAAALENVRQNKPEKFASGEEKDAWYVVHRLLGDMYMDEKPDQAVLCYQEFRQSDRAGADTMYKMGRAYENLGDLARAAKCYENVLAYEGHPLYYEARDGLERVKGSRV
jgi:tetratricopeptide (TPR) repeat protein